MILLDSASVLWLLGVGATGGWLFVCLYLRAWVYGILLALICASLVSLTVQDATHDRSADGGLFVRDAGAIIWRKAGGHD